MKIVAVSVARRKNSISPLVSIKNLYQCCQINDFSVKSGLFESIVTVKISYLAASGKSSFLERY